ncbi:hypothetical protein BRDCF_p1070 [Bacteroidales bacterium CF]|jgi:hypothetical protein|nr:hypothetical protein BRDCF_p1070 [Bacteroidales bacterium CF]
MPFVQEILKCRSLSIVGLEKNTGKTECFNYIIKRLPADNLNIAVTSIGLDGERVDSVTGTKKPEIFLRKGIYFATSEKLYKRRKILSEVVGISDSTGSLGRIITARTLACGKVMLAGPTGTSDLRLWMEEMRVKYKLPLCIIDGALSRMSLASPAVSEAMILTTGAALSLNINHLVQKTSRLVDLVRLPVAADNIVAALECIQSGIWGITKDKELVDLEISSALEIERVETNLLQSVEAIFISGALTDRFLTVLMNRINVDDFELIVRDFTKIFADHRTLFNYKRRGGKIRVLQRSNLIAVCVNPVSPNGTVLNSNLLCSEIENEIKVPVYDIIKGGYEA